MVGSAHDDYQQGRNHVHYKRCRAPLYMYMYLYIYVYLYI